MSTSLAIALVSPHAWPAYDDLTWRIEAEAQALARRGHRVTILAPVRGRDLVAQSRRTLSALRDGDTAVVLAAPGEVRVLPIGRGPCRTSSPECRSTWCMCMSRSPRHRRSRPSVMPEG
jgi:hypothetical protein